ncbi:MAG TPA: hypothetical protein VH165_18130 [Kofleriaceae bacterium]|jgi:hypothetical protein|nr:hypothetical protein [Kofleriaceae bacterium]
MTTPKTPVHPKVAFGDASTATPVSKSHQVVREPGHRKSKAHTPHPALPADRQVRVVPGQKK